MFRTGFLLIGVIILGALSQLSAEVDFKIKLDGLEDEVLVSLPANHEKGGTYPAVFYYHGTGGRPSVSLIRGHTGDDDWIVVGMAYARRGVLQITPAGMDAEQQAFREVRDRLVKEAGLDPKRVYVSGFSKGGWMSGLMLQQERSLAGAAILGAGHMHQLESSPRPLAKGTPVFVGVGRYDRNYPFALAARLFFEKLGGDVSIETWRGLGHQFPKWGSTGLKEWLALQNGKKPDLGKLEEDLAGAMEREGFERWWALLELRERPFIKASEGWLEKVDTARKEMESSDETIAREARILALSQKSLARELQPKTLERLEKIVEGYATIMESGGDSPQVETAEKDFERTGAILDAAREQFAELEQRRKEIEADNPTDQNRRRIPMNPLVR